jgi:chromate reductase
MSTITIISGTDRPNSNALRIANFIHRKFSSLGILSQVIDLRDFPLGDVVGGKYGKDIPSIASFNEPVVKSDGIVMVIPEYNGSFPGIFKLFIDYLPFPQAFKGMPIAFIGEASGTFGALRAVEQAQMVAAYRNAFLFPERVFITRVNENFDSETGLKVPLQAQLMDEMIQNFADFVEQRRLLTVTTN